MIYRFLDKDRNEEYVPTVEVKYTKTEMIDDINYLVKIKVEDNSYIDLVIKNVNKLRYVKDVKRV